MPLAKLEGCTSTKQNKAKDVFLLVSTKKRKRKKDINFTIERKRI